MDFITVITAAVLFSILLAWYALLEYLERRRRKDVKPPKPLPQIGGRGAARERGHEAGCLVTRQFWRSNGKPLPRGRPSPALRDRHIVFQGLTARYGFAVISVLLAHLLVTLGNLLFSFPPLIFFAAAVAVTLTLAGRAPGLFALILATLLSDFFFVQPTFVFSLDWQVFRLSLIYLFGGLLSVFISKRLSSMSAAN
jgi:hypothetical protein